MLLRIWTVFVDIEREQDYLNYARTRSRSMFLAQDGCLGVFFVSQENGRHAACSFWRDEAAVAALTGSTLYRSTVQGLVATRALRGEATVEVFAVTGGEMSAALESMLSSAHDARAQVGAHEIECAP